MKIPAISVGLMWLLMGCGQNGSVIDASCAPIGNEDRSSASLYSQANIQYPEQLLYEKIEGYVVMRFDVSRTGRPMNIEVINSQPDHLFSEAAVHSLSQWCYLPKVIQGKAVDDTATEVRLDFVLG
ncbi:energy transducer TonB [Shewanella sp. NIFS-20-20]|uniref:energy transducer TonB n=1 Tax=Shewanella sp. NIFS-20-20 TaxID=2853806 RepID=UPI001C473B1B|nr:energy transducer TonB [Shewanella sp. NIFS-20-20]MBV7316520.1 energy transducer TonB [Shewanella sp. NIFS-20-20]